MFKDKNKLIWTLTCVAFLLISAFAGGFAFNAVNRTENVQIDDTVDISFKESVESTEEVITKAPNTGDPVMTTAQTTAPETTTVETTTAPPETTSAVTSTAPPETTTAETTTTAPATTTTPPAEPEPVYPEDGEWNMLLVNPWNTLPDDYAPQLKSIGGGYQADYRVIDALNAMLADCRKAGYNAIVCSAYRTIQRQQVLFENEVKEFMSYGYAREEAEEYAAKWVARPGTSEHHTGLAFDIVSASYQALNTSQENTPEQKWLMANCHKYGFILRYPKDKTDITGINFEPWHYRYVGRDAAKIITEQGITFEEYILQGETS